MHRLLLAAVATLMFAAGLSHADGIPRPRHPGPCEPGFMWVEEVVYKEVCRKVCKVVPDVKKVTKWVYSCKPEDFCLPKCPSVLSGLGKCGSCESCMQCSKPMSRNLLVKRQVTEECPSSKCVIETVVERVPCATWKKVPCGEPVGPRKKVAPPVTSLDLPGSPIPAAVAAPEAVTPARTPADITIPSRIP